MFGAHETAVAAHYADAAARLIRLLTEPAFTTASHAAFASGQETLAQIGPFGPVAGLSKLVRINFLQPREEDNSLSVPLRWEATGPTGGLFPVLDADLILSPQDTAPEASPPASRTRLQLLYSYRPPLGRLGAAMDAAVLGKIADATIRSLVDDLAGMLAEPETSPADPARASRPVAIGDPAGGTATAADRPRRAGPIIAPAGGADAG
jgi:hypothetical protein